MGRATTARPIAVLLDLDPGLPGTSLAGTGDLAAAGVRGARRVTRTRHGAVSLTDERVLNTRLRRDRHVERVRRGRSTDQGGAVLRGCGSLNGEALVGGANGLVQRRLDRRKI